MEAVAPSSYPPVPTSNQARDEEDTYVESDVESLSAYFAACDVSSADSTRSSSLSSDDNRTSSPMPPLQGSASRPLLLRQRHASASASGDALSLPDPPPFTTAQPAASTKSLKSAGLPLSSSQQQHHAPAAAPSAVRGPAGESLAHQLQHARLPLEPADDSQTLTLESVRSCTQAFDFHLSSSTATKQKFTTTTITTRGSRSTRSPSSSTSAEARCRTRARQRAVLFDVLCALRQHATASCAQLRSTSGETGNDTPQWCLTEAVLLEARVHQWPAGFLGALRQLLRVADEVAAVDAHVTVLERVAEGQSDVCANPAADGAAAVSDDFTSLQSASAALELAGQKTLLRLGRVLRHLSADFVRWVLQVQEYLIHCCCCAETAAAAEEGEEEEKRMWRGNDDVSAETTAKYPRTSFHYESSRASTSPLSGKINFMKREDQQREREGEGDGVLPPPCSLYDVVLAVQENSIPLQRCSVLVDESGCFDTLAEHFTNRPSDRSPENEEAEKEAATPPQVPPSSLSFALLAARLLDTLIIHASAAQDTSTMDLYRFYVMLLLYTAWPYVLLCTSAIFGFVRDIDPPVWRRQLPRLFRSSFSHVRIGDAQRHYPTDVLSLLLNCVGYYNSVEMSGDANPAAQHPPQQQQQHHVDREDAGDASCSAPMQWERVKTAGGKRGADSKGQRRDVSERHVALEALASARLFVVRSLASFTRRKKQVALSRTPAPSSSSGAARSGSIARAAGDDEGSGGNAGLGGPALHSGKKAEEKRREAGSSAVESARPSWQQWQKKSVKEILHYILYESGGQDAETMETGNRIRDAGAYDEEGDRSDHVPTVPSAAAGAAVMAYAQQNQDVRRRVVQLPAAGTPDPTLSSSLPSVFEAGMAGTPLSADGAHYLYYPTTIPLGFATMMAEALPGQQQWQQQRDEATQRTSNDANATLAAHLRAPSHHIKTSRFPHSREGGDSDGESGSGSGDVLQRRALSLWTLVLSETATTPDVYFANAYATDEAAQLLDRNGEDGQGGGVLGLSSASTSLARRQRRARSHQLWVNVTIPCARWVTTALLIPIGVAVQRLQERRLKDLFSVSLQAVQRVGGMGGSDDAVRGGQTGRRCTNSGGGGKDGTGLLWRNNEDEAELENRSSAARHASPSSPSEAYVSAPGAGVLHRTSSGVPCSFLHALKLLIDVALCRDQERLVFTFLERLYAEPRWWARRWVDGGAGAFARVGTAAPTVSALFTDALRGKRLGELVRLVVLPAAVVRRERTSASGAAGAATSSTTTAPAETITKTDTSPSSSTIAADILDMFASFQLEFSLPGAFTLILQPRDLSVYVQPLTNTTERSYQTFFWQRRRRLYVEETATTTSSVTAAATPSSTLPTTKREFTGSSSSSSSSGGGVAFADVWSYVFGYQCSLYYAQITLREHKKLLHQRDTQDFEVAQVMGQPGVGVARHLQYVSRGLGSAYYTLTFAVDTLLSFMQAEAIRTVYEVEHLLGRAMRASPGVHSCMELCHELDTLLLQLHVVAFPARPAVAQNARERAMQSAAAEAVRGAVQRILEVALDPSRMPVSYISSATRNAVEALVAAVTAAEEEQAVLAARLHPLRVLLTFNKYYGSAEETLSYRFR